MQKNSVIYWLAIVALLVLGFVGTGWAWWQITSIAVAVLMAIYYIANRVQG